MPEPAAPSLALGPDAIQPRDGRVFAVTALLVALTLQPEDDGLLPPSPISEGDVVIFVAFIAVVALVFGFDMARTWWETTRWRREERRRRREIR